MSLILHVIIAQKRFDWTALVRYFGLICQYVKTDELMLLLRKLETELQPASCILVKNTCSSNALL